MPTSTVCCRQHRRASIRSPPAPRARCRAAPRAASRARCRWSSSPACSCRRAHPPRSGPSGRDEVRRTHAALAATDPAARLWSPPSTSGSAPASSDFSAASWSRWQTLAISPMYFFRSSAGRCVSGIGAGRSPLSTTRAAERRDAVAEAGDPERRRSHVDAAAAAAEIERHADDVNGLQSQLPSQLPNRTIRVAVGSWNWQLSSSLVRHRHAFARRRHDRREERRVVEDRPQERLHLVLLVHDVVRHEDAAGVQPWDTPCRRTSCSPASRRRGTRGRTCPAASGSRRTRRR